MLLIALVILPKLPNQHGFHCYCTTCMFHISRNSLCNFSLEL